MTENDDTDHPLNPSDHDEPPIQPLMPLIDAQSLMPTDDKTMASLQARAHKYAQNNSDPHAVNDFEDYIRFRLGDKERYGIAYRHVEQIIAVERLTHVPCTPKTIAGVINWRGLLLAVIDIGEFFSIGARAQRNHQQSSIIVVSDGKLTVGMQVDEIEENGQFSPSQLEAPLATGAVTNIAFVQGIYQGRITLLDVASILQDRQIIINKTESLI
ncbi:MAG: purine-binding chemotaxis protein CheW [Phenylobacterium sp.]|jgi:purine-binding chemotaxis protein CheW